MDVCLFKLTPLIRLFGEWVNVGKQLTDSWIRGSMDVPDIKNKTIQRLNIKKGYSEPLLRSGVAQSTS